MLKVKRIRIVLILAVCLSILLAYLPVTFESVSYTEETGNIVELKGIEAVRYKKNLQKDIAGVVTDQKVRMAVEECQKVFHEYGVRDYYELPDEKVFVTADRQRMEQGLTNLIENAKKYVRRGGEIRLAVNLDRDELRFSVYNDCASMNDQDISKIWRKFYRCPDNKCEGSGLGLAIVDWILSKYQADYGVRNVDQGVEFFFRFPILL